MAARILAGLCLVLALIGGGYWWGHTATNNAWTARQANHAINAQTCAADRHRFQSLIDYLNDNQTK